METPVIFHVIGNFVFLSYEKLPEEKIDFVRIRMKKGEVITGKIEYIDFPNKGIFFSEDGFKVEVKNALPGQTVKVRIAKKRNKTAKGTLLESIPSDIETATACEHFGICGGCLYSSVPYEKQLEIKREQIIKLLKPVVDEVADFDDIFEGIIGSPQYSDYRNKMEFSFGDMVKDGPLTLGMHKRGSFYDVVTTSECNICDADFRTVLRATLDFFTKRNVPYYHKMNHEGYLRHLLVRKAKATGEILVDLVTTTQYSWKNEDEANDDKLMRDYTDMLSALKYEGELTSVLHTKNDSLSDAVVNEGTDVLLGRDYINEEICGLKFKITAFSFFQTNSKGAEVLYEKAREFILGGKAEKDVDAAVSSKMLADTVYDLYSGTGTIAQILSPVAKKVIGVEIVDEAVVAARENAAENGIENCEFLSGDVLKVLDEIKEKPDYIVLDPPRDGIHPKAIRKIIDYGVDSMLYISCKPTSLARDLAILQPAGYIPRRIACVDMFPQTGNCESCVLLERVSSRKADSSANIFRPNKC